jgi:hypothetical protein
VYCYYKVCHKNELNNTIFLEILRVYYTYFLLFQTWLEISQLLSEKLQSLEFVLNDLEKVEICTDLNPEDEVAIRVIKRGQSSLTSSSLSLKSRIVNTQKLLNNLKS